MAQELSLFQQNNLAIPDFLKDFMAEESNIQPKAGVPTLASRGRKWSTVINGERTVFERVNADGDKEPVGVLRVIILDCMQDRGRTYYSGPYDPDKPGRPDCWSADGKAPDASVAQPVALKCKGCPMSIKGSKINELGKETVACAEHRLLAVVPAGNLKHPPMRFKLAITSDFDSRSPDLEKDGWFAFRNYTDWLRSKGIVHTAAVVTKIKFDPNVDYPKVIFAADALVKDPDQLMAIRELIKSTEVKDLITETWTPNGEDGVRTEEDTGIVEAQARTERPKVIEGEVVKEPFITEEMKKEAKAPRPRTTRNQEDKKPKAAAAEEDDPFSAAPTTAASAQPVEASAALPDDVASLLDTWG